MTREEMIQRLYDETPSEKPELQGIPPADLLSIYNYMFLGVADDMTCWTVHGWVVGYCECCTPDLCEH